MIIGIGGEPAAGKSTLMREILTRLGPGAPFKHGLVSGELYPRGKGVAVLGRYVEGDPFPGTDRLSMAVSPRFIEWLDDPNRPHTILFEGDRLFTGSVIDACASRFEPCRFLILRPELNALAHRRAMRVQSETFVRGRATKYRNLALYPNVHVFDHSAPEDTSTLADYVARLAEL